ncbi:carboxymuconolactone decarboxylase family protein [Streptomyces sp. H10-C2]|uniref:carboxymuconolactone decarboxylase family protein n=1 Tax=unclassified Streptomyces TaxID=2593676 RepID=UPI0024BB4345|nr:MULTISPECIES: carboxymuconolactone decarboxylase family protein [unclassified Streptomyces]MDJ0344994.1 carboxymuconolactone decarboxylase family protein [Streptomyces sp. PH10-H1]MDJ0373925.1 carboxymuconolactone decarboxylase family protein [Streptomyces sp. H10-C2]
MARISLTPPRTLLYRLGEWYSKRTYGEVLDPGKAYAHNTRVLLATTRFELRLAKWNKLDPGLKALAVMASAATIGCSWCMDFGYWESHERGITPEKLRNIPDWRAAKGVYTDLERLVMEYAEAMTQTVPTVTDEMARCLIGDLGEAAFVELTTMIAVENLRSRVNSAFGLVGQGFKDRCEIPARGVTSTA